jgi:hypothetical protein
MGSTFDLTKFLKLLSLAMLPALPCLYFDFMNSLTYPSIFGICRHRRNRVNTCSQAKGLSNERVPAARYKMHVYARQIGLARACRDPIQRVRPTPPVGVDCPRTHISIPISKSCTRRKGQRNKSESNKKQERSQKHSITARAFVSNSIPQRF